MVIAMFGGTGRLGSQIRELLLSSRVEVVNIPREQLDLSAELECRDLRKILDPIGPDVVVNCAGITDVNLCQRDSGASYNVNDAYPYLMAKWCKCSDVRFVHFSSNYIFGTEGPHSSSEDITEVGYNENFYGWHKLGADCCIEDIGGNYLIIRTACLYGGSGKTPTFDEKILSRAKNGEDLEIVDPMWTNPTYVPGLAEAAAALITSDRTGTIHVCGPEMTYLDLARRLLDYNGYQTTRILAVESIPNGISRPSVRLVPDVEIQNQFTA